MKKETFKFLTSISFFAFFQPIFFICIKFLQSNYHTIGSSFDNSIPFIPYFVYIYNLFYPFVILAFYYIYKKDKKNYYVGINAGVISTLIAYIIYILYSTIIIRPELSHLNIDPITMFVLKTTYRYDNPAINCFPSLHCVYSFIIIYITMLSHNINIKNKIFIIILSFLIIISTLFIKQHYILDILSAFLITIISTVIIKKIS